MTVLKHDLHKLKTAQYTSHSESLTDKLMKQADKVASMMSRNWMQFENKSHSPYRRCFISFRKKTMDRISKIQLTQELTTLFSETDPLKLHASILQSTTLNMYNESQDHPFTSIKYHLLLTCAIYYNLTLGYEWYQLYLHENPQNRSQFQVIYKDASREWTILPSGMSRVQTKFHDTWDQRMIEVIDDEALDNLLSRVGSWSAALAIMEEYYQRSIKLNIHQQDPEDFKEKKMKQRRVGISAHNDHQG